jgi:hypothetical protein
MEGVLAVKRIPIKVNRFPIKLPQEVRLHMKRQQLQEETREDDILAIAEHYNMCARKYKGSQDTTPYH